MTEILARCGGRRLRGFHSGLCSVWRSMTPRDLRVRSIAPQAGSAIFMYMKSTVGVAELRQNLSHYLRRVEKGERLLVTDRNKPVAELGPVPSGAELDRLIAAGRVSPPIRPGLPEALELDGEPYALSRALDEIRGER
jgi:prevent-host-death family protein